MDKATRLAQWNLFVVIVHFSSFVALTVIAFTNLETNRIVDLWIDFQKSTTVVGSYAIFITLIPFPAITALFHLLAYFNVDNYYASVLRRGQNRLRWIEYSITNGLMSWSVCVLSGAGNVWLAVLAITNNFLMQYFGHLHERANRRTWEFMAFGFLPWIVNWAVVFTFFFERISTALLYDSFAIFGTFVWSLTFTFPLFWRFYQKNTIENNYKVERAYILLSLTAKLWLDWSVTIGNLAQ
jgi:hypothetical protein